MELLGRHELDRPQGGDALSRGGWICRVLATSFHQRDDSPAALLQGGQDLASCQKPRLKLCDAAGMIPAMALAPQPPETQNSIAAKSRRAPDFGENSPAKSLTRILSAKQLTDRRIDAIIQIMLICLSRSNIQKEFRSEGGHQDETAENESNDDGGGIRFWRNRPARRHQPAAGRGMVRERRPRTFKICASCRLQRGLARVPRIQGAKMPAAQRALGFLP